MQEPNTWKNVNTHYIEVLKDPWYKQLALLENLITEETIKFYSQKDIKTMHFPVTTGSISSPMGRGSDSSPVKVNIEGKDTYLADSMQFLLEYGCRLFKNGCYYIMPSFRGEKADERHLCQFYHSEVEIPGNLEDIMDLAEEYVKYLSKRVLEEMEKKLVKNIGDVEHIKRVANCEFKFNKITFDEAEAILKEKYKEKIYEYIEYNDGWRNLTKKAEKELIKIYNGPVWVTNYDELAVPFYQKIDDNYVRNNKKC